MRGAMNRGAALCQFQVLKIRGMVSSYLKGRLSLYSLPGQLLHRKGVWTRRELNPHLHFDREPCYPLHHGP